MGTETVLEEHGMAVGLVERDITMHADMHIDRIDITHAARTELMEFAHLVILGYDAAYLVLHLGRQTFLEQVLDSLVEQFGSRDEDKEADEHSGYRIEYRPALAQQEGAAYAQGGSHGREGVGAMMPSVSLQRRRADTTGHGDSEPVDKFLGGDADQSCPECDTSRRV